MKIHIYYHTNFGRNDGSPLYYCNVLKNQMKFEVLHLVPDGDISRFGKADYHLWVDYGEDGLPTNKDWRIPDDGGKKIYIVSDAHFDKQGKEYRFNKALQFDYVFFNQKRALQEFSAWTLGKKNKKPSEWHFLPHAAEPKAFPKIEILKRWDMCFIGHVQRQKNYNGITRIEALDRLFKEFPLGTKSYFGTRTPLDPRVNVFEDAARKFSQSRIVFNISATDDINMRTFETLSTGSFLLTNWIPTIDDLFIDGTHLVTYHTMDEAIEKAKYYLEHEDEREKIAQAGYEEFIKKHTYKHRMETILRKLGELY